MTWLAACDGGTPSDAVALPPPELLAYRLEGAPGPWWRDGADKAAFDVDAKGCVRASNEARAAAADDPYDAAYRTFLECMQGAGWTRGMPSPTPASLAPRGNTG